MEHRVSLFEIIADMPEDFLEHTWALFAAVDNPIARECERKLRAAIRLGSCGTGAAAEQSWSSEVSRAPRSERRGRFEDPRLAELHKEEAALREQMRRERIQAAEKRGLALAEASTGTLERVQDGWLDTYEALRGDGLSHRHALNQIADSTGTRGKGGESIDTLVIASGISAARARRTKERRAARDREILKLTKTGVSPREIAERLGTTVATVKNVLAKRRARKGVRSV